MLNITRAFLLLLVPLSTTLFVHSMIFSQKQFNTAGDIPSHFVENRKSIYGKVIRVIDGDTVRIRHAPTGPLFSSLLPPRDAPPYQGKLSEHTISVRLYGVDAPETAKFGNPGMPHAEDAKRAVSELVLGKIVRVKILRVDQYGRIVGRVQVRRGTFLSALNYTLPLRDVSVFLGERGLVTLYTGGGAEYDNREGKLRSAISSAQRWRRGIWTEGKNTRIMTPAEYKRKHKK